MHNLIHLQLSQMQPLLAVLSEIERVQMTSVVRRAETLAQCAQERGVRLMIDAEQTYYQPAIRHVAVNVLMPKYNLAGPVIYNTQQCYCKVSDTESIIECLCPNILHAKHT